jgi:hypothetical protein
MLIIPAPLQTSSYLRTIHVKPVTPMTFADNVRTVLYALFHVQFSNNKVDWFVQVMCIGCLKQSFEFVE